LSKEVFATGFRSGRWDFSCSQRSKHNNAAYVSAHEANLLRGTPLAAARQSVPWQRRRATPVCPDLAVSFRPPTHCTKRAAAKSSVTSGEERLKRALSHNSYFLSSRTTAKTMSLCNVSFPTKFLLPSKYSREIPVPGL